MSSSAKRRTTSDAPVPRPMLATTSEGLPNDGRAWVFEPKYDGIRVVAAIDGAHVTLRTRSGRDTATAFPEIVAALARLGEVHAAAHRKSATARVVIDGELVALEGDAPARFGALQPRLFVTSALTASHRARTSPAALVVFDCLELDGVSIVERGWRERRALLDSLMREWDNGSGIADALRTRLRVSPVSDDGAELLASAARGGEEGIIAKDPTATYHAGKRSDVWRKVKLEASAEFLVIGVTAEASMAARRATARAAAQRVPPLPTRIGALVLGERAANGRVTLVGKVGSGMTQLIATELARRLKPIVRAAPPDGVRDDAAVTWVEPRVVVSVRYLERTSAGALRQPVLIGLRDDVVASEITHVAPVRPEPPRAVRDDATHLPGVPAAVHRAITTTLASIEATDVAAARTTIAVANVAAHAPELLGTGVPARAPLVDASGWSWTIESPLMLSVTTLDRPLGEGVTKRDLLRYYATVAPYLLRALAGRPLVLRRHTDLVAGTAFYQQHVAAAVPAGVDTAIVASDAKARYVGGALVTLLYLAQLGAVSMDPWHGRADAPELVDYAIVDLDPGPDAPFTRVVDVARWVHDELTTLGLNSIPKTSGASGMHIVVPLPSDTPADAARLLAELVATQVSSRHRQVATIARAVRSRATNAIYVDFLQNIVGKTVASVYAARATPTLTVSTPLRWDEVTPALDPRDFTIRNVPARLAEVGDLWGEGMLRGNDIDALRRRTGSRRE